MDSDEMHWYSCLVSNQAGRMVEWRVALLPKVDVLQARLPGPWHWVRYSRVFIKML